jgi:glycine hydroxymethyltransferase
VEEAVATANLIADTLEAPQDAAVHARVRAQVAALTGRFPVYSPAAT